MAACDYEGLALDLVHAFKRSGSRALARFLAKPMADLVAQELADRELADQDLAAGGLAEAGSKARNHGLRLVPVPSRPDSMRRRGYVPAQLLAQEMAPSLKAHHGIASHASPLVKLNRKVKDQATLNLKERTENLTGAMLATPFSDSRGFDIDDSRRNVVIVDDVVTTGATIQEMHRALTAAGWKPIFFVAFAETL